MSNFTPDKQEAIKVPFFNEATASKGWAGHGTGKGDKTLKREIHAAMERLGGMITGFVKGTYHIHGQKRHGYEIHFVLDTPGTDIVKGKIDIAALPVKDSKRYPYEPPESTEKQSLRMALYMARDYLMGLWHIQQLSPGSHTLMPFMIDNKTKKTYSQLFSEGVDANHLLGSGFESDEPWWEVLGLPDSGNLWDQVEEQYRKMAKEAHPDVQGGSNQAFTRLQTAYEAAKEDFAQ